MASTSDEYRQYERNFEEGSTDDLTTVENINEEAVADVIKSRYAKNLIYTYIGPIVVSVNPYKQVPIYGTSTKSLYHKYRPFELAPHLYSLAEDAFRTMLETGKPQTMIISGESGAGKTEACKKIMEYLAKISISGALTEMIHRTILESNPVLEAFGNAKTIRNDNSSRFGKYMDLFFNFRGQLEGGYITTSLLEKSRVVTQRKGERNFHIFYQMCAGADDLLRRELSISTPKNYQYLNQSDITTIPGVDDKREFQRTCQSMTDAGITLAEQMEIFRIIAAILHLGNMRFFPVNENNQEGSDIENRDVLTKVAGSLAVDEEVLKQAILFKTIQSGTGGASAMTHKVPQKPSLAAFNRDALAKGIYERLFHWLIRRINSAMKRSDDAKYSIGLLDIYGFEIYEKGNSYEQLCINYTNEKIQQQIQRWLLDEQQDYVNEGVPILETRHFDCDECAKLIEEKPQGIFSYLDEECMFPNGSDSNYLSKLNTAFAKHKYYEIPKLEKNAFNLQHFAAKVCYDVRGWIDKNKDTLNADLVIGMQSTKSELTRQLFPTTEVIEAKGRLQKTMSMHFKLAVNGLMGKITGKKSHFVRCMLPNHQRKPDDCHHPVVLDQVRYLGLLENILVRRCGYYYKIDFEKFLDRYKLCAQQTWPKWQGDPREGCEIILRSMGMDPTKYAMGKSKVFLQSPMELFALDEKMQSRKADLATLIQKTYKRYKTRQVFLEYKLLASTLEKTYGETGDLKFKVFLNELFQKKDGVAPERKRKILAAGNLGLYTVDPTSFAVGRRIKYANIQQIFTSPLSDGLFVLNIPSEYDCVFESENKMEVIKQIMDAYEQACGAPLHLEIAEQFSWNPRKGVMRNVNFKKNTGAKTTIIDATADGLTVDVKPQLDIFDGKKMRRKNSFQRKFYGDYIHLQKGPLMEEMNRQHGDASVSFSAVCTKYNKKFKAQDRVLMITEKAIYNLDPNGYMVNRRIPLHQIRAVTVSPLTDGFFVVHVPDEYDYVFDSNKKTEVLKVLADNYLAATRTPLKFDVRQIVKFNMNKGEPKELHFQETIEHNETVLVPNPEYGADVFVRMKEVMTGQAMEIEGISDIYLGQKQRRKDSMLRWMMGDYLFYEKSPFFTKLQESNGDSKILFSGMVNKVNKRYKVQERKLIVTDQAIYNMGDDGSAKTKRRIPLANISAIAVSTMKDGFFVVRVPDEYDYFYESYKKTEIIKNILDAYKKITGKNLELNVDDRLEYSTGDISKGIKTIEFKQDNTLLSPVLTPTNTGVMVMVNNNEDYGDPEKQADNVGMKDKIDSCYTGRKYRRKKSFFREKLGDYLRLADSPKVRQIFKQYGDGKLLFSGEVTKLNKAFKAQNRILIVSDKAVYNVDPEHFKVKRRIPLDDIDGVSVSSLTDGHFVLHIPKEYDYLFESDKKTEVIDTLAEAITKRDARTLKVNVGDQFEYCPAPNELSTVSFVLDDNVKETVVEPTSAGLVVHVQHDEPRVVLEAAYIHVKDQPKPIEVRNTPVLVKLRKRWKYKLEIRFYVNESLEGCMFYEKIDTVTSRQEYQSQVALLEKRDERYVIMLPERRVIYSLLSKTRVKAKLIDPLGKVLLAVRFVYDVR